MSINETMQSEQEIQEGTQQKGSAKPESKKEKKDKKLSEADFAALNTRLEKAEGDTIAAKEALLRTAAEYDNFRKRSQREKDDAFGNGISHAVNILLPVLDTLDLAANAKSEDEEYKKGVVMTLTKCAEAFKALGIEEIDALGAQFNPEIHAAVMQQASESESGTIINVLQKGYLMHGKVIRHSTVIVAE